MRPEVFQFYHKHFGGVEGFKRDIESSLVEQAAEMVYDRHLVQPYPNLLVVGHQVRGVAKAMGRIPGYKMEGLPKWQRLKRFFYYFNPIWSGSV